MRVLEVVSDADESSTAPALPLRLLLLDRSCCSPDHAPHWRRAHPPAPCCRPRCPFRAPRRTLRHARASPRTRDRAKIPRPWAPPQPTGPLRTHPRPQVPTLKPLSAPRPCPRGQVACQVTHGQRGRGDRRTVQRPNKTSRWTALGRDARVREAGRLRAASDPRVRRGGAGASPPAEAGRRGAAFPPLRADGGGLRAKAAVGFHVLVVPCKRFAEAFGLLLTVMVSGFVVLSLHISHALPTCPMRRVAAALSNAHTLFYSRSRCRLPIARRVEFDRIGIILSGRRLPSRDHRN